MPSNVTKINQMRPEDAIAMLPEAGEVAVMHVFAMAQKQPQALRWGREYAADKIRHHGVFKALGSGMPGFGIYITDSNGDQFFMQTEQQDG